TRGGQAALVVAVLLLPAVSGALYLGLGAPTLPDRPFAARGDEGGGGPGPDAAPQIAEMVARLEKRLETQPDDVEGWLMLGRSRGVLGDAPGAVAALRKAQGLAPEDARVLGGLGEALVAAADGMVTPVAKGLLERLRQAGPGVDPRAAYYLGLAAAQAGDNAAALDQWRGLLASAPADAPWRSRVEEMVRQAARDSGQDPEAVVAAIPKAAPAAAPAGPPAQPARAAAPGPTPEEVAAAGQMAPEEQETFIRSMVDRLEARLATNKGDVEGWRRLAQARLVLGERDRAREAYEQALAANPNDAGLLKGQAGLLLGPARPDTGLPEVNERARGLYERAAAAAPDDPEPRWYLGISALQQGRRDEAREHWRLVLARLGPTHPEYASVKQRLDSLGG
ncbi:MAG TPA: tetratricopeptide repeat protein, partial [Geminicoccaceae bacterium]